MTKKEADQLNAAKADIKDAWTVACNHDGISPDSKFVVFSNDNPAAIRHNILMLEFMKLRNRIARNVARRERHAAMKDLGLRRVRGSQGGVFYE